MRTCLIPLFGIWLAYPLRAQTLQDPVYFQYTLLPGTDLKRSPGRLTVNSFEVNATAPLAKIGSTVKLFHSLYYRYTAFGYSDTPTNLEPLPPTLHDGRYSVIVRAAVHPRWEIVALPRVLLRSDLQQSLRSRDFFPSVIVLGNYAVRGNPDFKIGFGFALNNDFRRNALIPIGSLVYNSSKVKVEIVYPTAQLLYKTSKNLEWGLFAMVDGAISRVDSPTVSAAYLRTFQVLVAPMVTRRLYQNLFGHLKIGDIPTRTLTLLDAQFETLSDQEYRLQSSWFVRAGVSFRLTN